MDVNIKGGIKDTFVEFDLLCLAVVVDMPRVER